MDGDFLDEVIAEETRREPRFPAKVDAGLQRRRLLRQLAAARKDTKISQTVIAARMETSQSQLGRLENGDADPRLSTIQRYAAALGLRLELQFVAGAANERTAIPAMVRRNVAI